MENTIYPCLWFDGQAKAAATFYCAIFPNSKIVSENPMVVIWEHNGGRFMGLNGGHTFQHSEAVSFVVQCKDQQEIDFYWESLTADGGKESRCGWLKDKFGVSWQIVPAILATLMADPARAGRVSAAFMKMKKLDIEVLKNA